MFTRGGPSLRELIQQALSSTDRGYDLLAPKFDLTPFRTPDPLLQVVATVLSAGGQVERGIDLCCGTGAGLRMLGPLCTGAVVGLDRSAGMLAEAARRQDRTGPAPLLLQGDVLAPPFAGTFDLATCFGAFGHILEHDEPRFVSAVHGLLRPGGRFAFFTARAPPLLHPATWLARGFNAAMRIRNALIDPPFHMYYLTFLLPRATALLEAQGFAVDVHEGLAPAPFNALPLVVATKPR